VLSEATTAAIDPCAGATAQRCLFDVSADMVQVVLTMRPLISKRDIIRAYNPSKPESEAVFRRLRAEGVISEGITIKPRRAGRQRGTITAFCSLNEDAAIAFRHGDRGLAVKIAGQADKVEQSAAGRELAKVAATAFDRSDVTVDVDGMYLVVEAKNPEPLKKLARRAAADRRRFDKRMTALGARSILARVQTVRAEGAELEDEAGVHLWMPATPELLAFGEHGAPVLVRSELMHGVLWTYVEKAYALEETIAVSVEGSPDPGAGTFEGLRPPMPQDLPALLERAPLRPLTATGPALRWT
jgi:hypothetical protein